MQKILSRLRNACDKYNLIEENDKIAVGLSGGKDSLALVSALALYAKFSPKKFRLVAITVDLYNKPENLHHLVEYCKKIGVEYHIVPSNIFATVFEIRKEKNPCSLCSKLRKGMLVSAAKNLNCNKIAMGHTADDVLHTFFLSMFFEGRLNTILPTTYLDRENIHIIRPLINTDEVQIKKATKNLPVKKSICCPVDKNTKREEVKKLIDSLENDYPLIKKLMFRAITSPERYHLFKD